MKSRVVLVTVGSLGDLHPFIALGLALQARGADVVLACAAEYREKVRAAGLAFHPVRPSFDDMERYTGMDRAQLTQAVLARSDFLLRRLIAPGVRMSYDDLEQLVKGADLLLTSSLAFGARLAAERHAVRWIAVVLQPLMFLSAYDPPVIPGAEWLRACLRLIGPKATRAVFVAAKLAVDRMLRPVHMLRAQIGLQATPSNALFEGQFSPDGAIGLYSKVLGAVRADYPQPVFITGFATFDSPDGAAPQLEPSLSAFLQAGPAPLVFTLGSLIVHNPGSFYLQSLAAARVLGKRAVLLVGDGTPTAYASFQGADVHVCAYAPHSLLFPRAEVIVHHGGVGTLAQALRSARPHLIVPYFADQADNASRAVQLGVARSLVPRRYAAKAASRELSLLVGDVSYAKRARDISNVLAAEDGAAAAAAVVMDRLESRFVNDGESACS